MDKVELLELLSVIALLVPTPLRPLVSLITEALEETFRKLEAGEEVEDTE